MVEIFNVLIYKQLKRLTRKEEITKMNELATLFDCFRYYFINFSGNNWWKSINQNFELFSNSVVKYPRKDLYYQQQFCYHNVIYNVDYFQFFFTACTNKAQVQLVTTCVKEFDSQHTQYMK